MSYAPSIAMALRLITDKGSACTWRQTTPVVNALESWKEDASTPVDFTTVVVLLPFDSSARRMFGYEMGAVVPVGTMMAYVPGSEEFSPALRDTIIVGSKVYSVGAFDTLNPDADKDIIYVLELHQ